MSDSTKWSFTVSASRSEKRGDEHLVYVHFNLLGKPGASFVTTYSTRTRTFVRIYNEMQDDTSRNPKSLENCREVICWAMRDLNRSDNPMHISASEDLRLTHHGMSLQLRGALKAAVSS